MFNKLSDQLEPTAYRFVRRVDVNRFREFLKSIAEVVLQVPLPTFMTLLLLMLLLDGLLMQLAVKWRLGKLL